MPSDKEQEETNPRTSWLKYLFFISAGVLFLITALLFGVAASIVFCPDWVLSQGALSLLQSSAREQTQQSIASNPRGFLVTTAGTLGSLAVSLALTGVYLSQNDIMQDQVEAQTQQLRSMRQEKLPLLGVHGDGVELHDTKPLVEDPDDSPLEMSTGDEGCWASVAVENHGDEIAQQAHMACLIDFPEIEDEPPLVSGICAMESTKTVTDSPVGNGALVSSGTGLVLLRGTPRLHERTPHGFERTTFRDKITTQIIDEGRTVRFGFILIYTNSMEQRFKVNLSSRTARPENFDSYEKTDVTSDRLMDRSTKYPTKDLIKESGWNMPEDVFVPHDQYSWDESPRLSRN